MRVLTQGIGILAAAFLVALPSVASAQSAGRPASSNWFDGYGRSASDRLLDLQAAEAERRAREGGYGPAESNTTVNGDVNNYTTNNGPQNTSTAYNSVNSNSTTTNASGTGIDIMVSTGQTSGTATQNADAKSLIGTATTTTTCGGNNSCN